MAELEQAVYSRLTGHAGLAALVGSRVYPLVLPQRPTLPAVTYQRVEALRQSAMGVDTGLASARVQVDSWATTYAGSKGVAAQVRAALQRWRGTEAGVTVEDAFLERDQDLFEDEGSSAEGKLYRVSQDYLIWYRE